MKIFFRVLIGAGVLLTVFVLLFSFLVRLYLTPEKLREFTVSKGQEVLGRKVELEKIEVGLLKGILLKNLAVKEEDGKSDFVRLESLRFRFRLFPLLKRELVLTEAELTGLYLHLVREKGGGFNWETLKIFSKKSSSKTSVSILEKKSPEAAFLALSIPALKIRQAKLVFEDKTGGFPRLVVPFEVEASFSFQTLSAKLHFQLFGKPFEAETRLEEYLSSPALFFRLQGETLDLNPFFKEKSKRSASYPSPGSSQRSPKKASPKVGIPVARAQAEIAIERIIYKKLVLLNSRLIAHLAEGRLVADYQGKVGGGTVTGRVEVDFTSSRPFWKLKEAGKDIEISSILFGLYPDLPGRIQGRLAYKGLFSGRGLSLEEAKRSLIGRGWFEIAPLELSEIPITTKLSRVLNLPELKTVLFSRSQGEFEIKNQRVRLKADLAGPLLSVHLASGTVDFNGYLDLPLNLVLAPDLSKKLTQRLPLATHLRRETGEVEMTVELKGPYRKPRVVLRARSLERSIQKKIKEILPEGTEEIFKGLLGR